MAVKQRRPPPTTKEKQQMDRVQRARKGEVKLDRHGAYREACAELAEETGGCVEAIWEEFSDRAAARQYLGVIEADEAERLALVDVQERFRAAS